MALLLECPACGWHPTATSRWQCSCGHRWNTFSTQGKCPACATQWHETDCLRCGEATPHRSWYHQGSSPVEPEAPDTPVLLARQLRLEQRLRAAGISNAQLTYLPYLRFAATEFQTPYAIGCRLLILYVLSAVVHDLTSRPPFSAWLQAEGLWEHVSAEEQAFLSDPTPEARQLSALSWQIEGVFLLGWVLNLIPTLPEATRPATEEELELVLDQLPAFGDRTDAFLQHVRLRPAEEIFEENLFHEQVTTYFRDLLFNGQPDETVLQRVVSFERHRTLNWVRQFAGLSDWDDTDTST